MTRRGVLFDLDGVLVATEALKARAHTETVERLGGRLDPAYYGEVMGRSHYEAAKAFSAAGGVDFDHERYASLFRAAYGRLLEEGVEPMPGAEAAVAALRDSGYRLAVVSSSLGWMVEIVLERIGLGRHFEARVSGDDVAEEKPSPEPYRKALGELGLEPDRAVIVEDTESGVASGVAAGVPVIAIRHEFNGRHDLSGAAAVLDGLADTDAVLHLVKSLSTTP